jgi:hypothetical protein
MSFWKKTCLITETRVLGSRLRGNAKVLGSTSEPKIPSLFAPGAPPCPQRLPLHNIGDFGRRAYGFWKGRVLTGFRSQRLTRFTAG